MGAFGGIPEKLQRSPSQGRAKGSTMRNRVAGGKKGERRKRHHPHEGCEKRGVPWKKEKAPEHLLYVTFKQKKVAEAHEEKV